MNTNVKKTTDTKICKEAQLAAVTENHPINKWGGKGDTLSESSLNTEPDVQP